MELKEKYISAAENSVKPDPKRLVLSNDAYAICEFIEILNRRIEKLRLSLK